MARLSPRRFRGIAEVFDAVLPPIRGVSYPEAALRDFLEDFFARAPLDGRLALVLGVALVRWTPLLTIGVPRRLGGLSQERRRRHLDKLYHSRRYLVRQLVFLVRMFASFAKLGERSVQEALAFRGAGRDAPEPAPRHEDVSEPS